MWYCLSWESPAPQEVRPRSTTHLSASGCQASSSSRLTRGARGRGLSGLCPGGADHVSARACVSRPQRGRRKRLKVCSHCCKPEELGLEGRETGWTPGHLESLQVCWVREATGATKNWQLLEPAPEVAFSEEGYPRASASAQAQFFPPKAAPASNLHRPHMGLRAQTPRKAEDLGPGCLDHSQKVNGSVGFPLPSLPLSSH